MDLDWRTLTQIAALVALALALSACTALGTGRSTLILADPPTGASYPGTEYQHLITTEGRKLVGLQGKSAATHAAWSEFQQSRYGSTSYSAARIDINVRDQTVTPALDLFNIETVTAADVAKILTDESLSPDQKQSLLTQLRDNFRGMPETYSRLVSHGIDPATKGINYYYFPQVTVDLTGTLNSAEPLDRFDFLAVAIRIRDDSPSRFINFSPKVADLFDYTLGQFKQSASASANATAGRKTTETASTTNKPTGGPETASGTGGELNLGGGLSVSLSDELTRDLKSSLEARSAGILRQGKLFLIELRSNELKRIAGTYSFNVMLEVPSTVDKVTEGALTFWKSKPKATQVVADVRVVGIVRHVLKPGKTGTFKRVPEPLNDETFREVVMRDETATLWTFNNTPLAQLSEASNLTIYSNADGASFTIYDDKDAVLGHGNGREAHFAVPEGAKVKIVFHPIVAGGDHPVMLRAPEVPGLTVGKSAVAVGSYTLKE